MKQLTLIIAVVILFISSKKNEIAISDNFNLETYVDSLFHTGIDNHQLAGGAILVYQKDKIVLKKSYGYASLELAAPMPDDAKFEIGSITKQFTAAAILKLVEANKLSLDDDFTKYLDFDTKGRTVTINNLLNHTSGIPNYTALREFWNIATQNLPRDVLVRLVERNDFLFEPGEVSIYNNSAYFFLGLIIEKVSGQSYQKFLRKEFFEPLGMENTNFASNTKVIKNNVSGYTYFPNGLRQKSYFNPKWGFSGGSICSTTEDLLLWMTALHKRKIFSESLYQSLITPDQLNDGTPLRYAKGISNFSNLGNHQLSHGGWLPGFLSEARFFPDDDLYIICLTNTESPKGAGFITSKVVWKLLNKKEPKGIELDLNIKDLEGTYTGLLRGGQPCSIHVKSIVDGLTIQEEKRKRIDTLKTYIGNNTWMHGNNKIKIKNNEYHLDEYQLGLLNFPGGSYILRKTE